MSARAALQGIGVPVALIGGLVVAGAETGAQQIAGIGALFLGCAFVWASVLMWWRAETQGGG